MGEVNIISMAAGEDGLGLVGPSSDGGEEVGKTRGGTRNAGDGVRGGLGEAVEGSRSGETGGVILAWAEGARGVEIAVCGGRNRGEELVNWGSGRTTLSEMWRGVRGVGDMGADEKEGVDAEMASMGGI